MTAPRKTHQEAFDDLNDAIDNLKRAVGDFFTRSLLPYIVWLDSKLQPAPEAEAPEDPRRVDWVYDPVQRCYVPPTPLPDAARWTRERACFLLESWMERTERKETAP